MITDSTENKNMLVHESLNSSTLPWPDPTEKMLNDPMFDAIWNVIKRWDINVPGAYWGYCGATGNHVRAILDGLQADGLGTLRKDGE